MTPAIPLRPPQAHALAIESDQPKLQRHCSFHFRIGGVPKSYKSYLVIDYNLLYENT